jgi:serine/threonine protein kinase
MFSCLFELLVSLDQFGDYLGGGSFGKVHEAVHLETGRRVAIKSVDVEKFKKMAEEEEAIFLKLKDSSPYLVNLIECFEIV